MVRSKIYGWFRVQLRVASEHAAKIAYDDFAYALCLHRYARSDSGLPFHARVRCSMLEKKTVSGISSVGCSRWRSRHRDLMQRIEENRIASIFRFDDNHRIRAGLLRRNNFKFGLVVVIAFGIVRQFIEAAQGVPWRDNSRNSSPGPSVHDPAKRSRRFRAGYRHTRDLRLLA